MRILFSMRSFWYVKTYDQVIRALIDRGHEVHLLAEFGNERDQARNAKFVTWNRAVFELHRQCPQLTYGWVESAPGLAWHRLLAEVRLGLDYLRYLGPRYRDTPKLGQRARRRALPIVRRLARVAALRRPLRWALSHAERVAPVERRIYTMLERAAPDLLLITPLVTLASAQNDLVRAARALRLPVGVCVGSWDHLSSKALIRVCPDRLFVWNDVQRREAVELHGMPEDRVVSTGAQCFDHWFNGRPSESREAFLSRVGLPVDKPFITYVCTALLAGTPEESGFVIRWAQAIRQHPALRDVSILVRPHPHRTQEWIESRAALEALDAVVLWPRKGTPPNTDASRAEYFDSLYHSAAVIGLNTTAMIEAGILDRPVLTVILPEYQDNQLGTIHFHYLLEVGGGLLQSARSLEEHAEHVAAVVGGSAVRSSRAFVEAFVRPRGLDHPASSIFADEVERLAAMPTLGPEATTRWDGLAVSLLALMAPLFKTRYRILLADWRRQLQYRRRRQGLTRRIDRWLLRALVALDPLERQKQRQARERSLAEQQQRTIAQRALKDSAERAKRERLTTHRHAKKRAEAQAWTDATPAVVDRAEQP